MKLKKYNQFINEAWVDGVSDMAKYNKMIDYTLLDNNATTEDIISLCEAARIMDVKSVCVMPKHVHIAAEELSDCGVLVCTVISFPEGTNTNIQKEKETIQVIQDGADEVDMVLNYQNLKKNWNENNQSGAIPHENDDLYITVVEEIGEIAKICHSSENKDNEPIILKVIVESGRLDIDQTEFVTNACMQANADFIKTSTGKVEIGAELDKVKAMYNIIQNADEDNSIVMYDEHGNDENIYPYNINLKIKASGGVRTMEDIKKFEPYVDRFGMGYAAVDALNGLERKGDSNY